MSRQYHFYSLNRIGDCEDVYLNLIGNTPASLEKFALLYEQGDLKSMMSLGGEYVAIFTVTSSLVKIKDLPDSTVKYSVDNRSMSVGSNPEEMTLIISSIYGIQQYFYTVINSQFYHGQSVLEVLRSANLSWEYNYQALANVAILEHTLGQETLHSQIFRIPSRSIVMFSDGKLSIQQLDWQDFHQNKTTSTPEQALQIFNQSCERLASSDNILSMSGGYDSRLQLSYFLKTGQKPYLLTQGFADSTDVVISQAIAQRFNLELEVIPLELQDYFKVAREVSALTGGTKSFWHWHTYIYPYRSQLDHHLPLFIGSNGEFARCYYADTVPLLSVVNVASPVLLPVFWALRSRAVLQTAKQCFRHPEFSRLNPEFMHQIAWQGVSQRIFKLCQGSHWQFTQGLDRLYLEERVRTLISNGLKLYERHFAWQSPFLDQRWIECIANLPQVYKRHSFWHHFAIGQNYPQLLEFEFEKNVKQKVSYARYSQWLSSPEVLSWLLDRGTLLESILDYRLLANIVQEQRDTQKRTGTIAFLLAQAAWQECIQAECLTPQPQTAKLASKIEIQNLKNMAQNQLHNIWKTKLNK